MNAYLPQNGRFPASGWVQILKVAHRIKRAYQVSFPERVGWGDEKIPLTMWGIRDALLKLNKRFQSSLFPLSFNESFLHQLKLRDLDEDFLTFIPFDCFGLDVMFTEPIHFSNYKAPLDFLMYCILKDMLLPEPIENYFGDCPYPYVFPEDWNLVKQEALFECMPMTYPLSNFALALRSLACISGNPWVDTDPDVLWEMPSEFPIAKWTYENVCLLKDTYAEGITMSREVDRLVGCFCENGAQKIKTFLVLFQHFNRHWFANKRHDPTCYPSIYSENSYIRRCVVKPASAATGKRSEKTIFAQL